MNIIGKTRHSSGTKISDFLGGGRELLESELPTVRCAMRATLHLQEQKVLIEGTAR